MGLGAEGSGFRDSGQEFRYQGVREQEVKRFGLWVQGVGLRVEGRILRCRVLGAGRTPERSCERVISR